MTLAEIVELTFKYHRAIYISLTQKCPIRCAHCFVKSGPEREDAADLAEFQKWIDGLVATPGMDLVFFSGGEPFSHPHALRYGLAATAAAGRYSVIATSAFWAKSDETANQIFDRYPRPGALCISTDIYHEQFVPLSYIRTAAKAARERSVDVTVQLTKTPTGYDEFLKRFEHEVGFDLVPQSEIFVAEFSSTGRALTECGPEVGTEEDSADIPTAPCVWLGTPWLRENGVLCACPNTKVFETAGHAARIGHLNRENFSTVSRRASDDYYIQGLRVLGPKGLAERLSIDQLGWKPESVSGESICDLCHSIASVPDLPNKIRERIKQVGLDTSIDALRLALYGEIASCDDRRDKIP